MSYIEIKNLTKDYGDNRGIFNMTINIEKGETIGFVGTNGAGKTTTIRAMMGFIKPTSGSVTINGLDTWKDSMEVKKLVGYVPGEIAFPDDKTGESFLLRQAQLNKTESLDYAYEMIDKLQLDPTANLKRMSKGMKQKTAIAAALMNDSDILILDEPTTGLDPLMRMEFLDIIKEEQKRGKTIFMSSHIFEEIEEVCDKVVLIKDGTILATAVMNDIRHRQIKTYEIEFKSFPKAEEFVKNATYEVLKHDLLKVKIRIKDKQTNDFIKDISKYNIKYIKEEKYTLGDFFDEVYEKEAKHV